LFISKPMLPIKEQNPNSGAVGPSWQHLMMDKQAPAAKSLTGFPNRPVHIQEEVPRARHDKRELQLESVAVQGFAIFKTLSIQ
jgi:hypothetical protein